MDNFLNGKCALVTGGSRGIGRATVSALLEAGAKVAFCGRNAGSLQAALAELSQQYPGRVAAETADVSDPEQVAALFQSVDSNFGGLDILVNNAGIGIFAPAADLTIDEWHETINTNLTGAFLCSREAISRFRIRGGGALINISSLAGKNPFAGGSAYNASKFGLNGFSEAMMLDHRYENIKVSYVMPGSVETAFRSGSTDQPASWKIAPEDVAEIVLTILRMPARTLISRVEVRPAKPAKA